MTPGRRLSWALTATSGLLVATSVVATVAIPPGDDSRSDFLLFTYAFVFTISAFSVVGGLITSRHPGNVIGWLLAVIGPLFATVTASSTVVRWGLLSGGIPEGVAEWIGVGTNSWVVALGLIGTQLLIRLPDGRLPSPRWRWYSRATIALIAIATIGMATQPGPVEGIPGTSNPVASTTLAPLATAFLLVICSFVVAIVALVMRYRRSTGHDRAQLRWVAFSGAFFVTFYLVNLAMLSYVDEDSAAGNVFILLAQVAFAALPIGIGFAVLRHRLYDIDVVINRALVYGTLTAILAGTYLGSVLLLQLILDRFTQGSGLAVAASTLATAALVRPARARIQASVDRRFFRRKYDAARTLERFGTRLRDEVDLDALSAELRAVVADTMQPAHVTLWVREPERAS